jgi:uncharacterized protein YlxW (UPF0749 family)
VIEERIGDLRGDVQALTTEMERARKRLHNLEATNAGLVKAASVRAEIQAAQAQRTQRWIQVLTLAVACAGVVGPLVYSGIGHL